jgi:hypothetical protein
VTATLSAHVAAVTTETPDTTIMKVDEVTSSKWIEDNFTEGALPMPVHIISKPSTSVAQGNRGRHFDQAVRALAPAITEVRSAGVRDVRKLAEQLNKRGISAPSGRPFSYGTMHRILVRLKKLRLGDGPQSRFCKRRPPKSWVRSPRRSVNWSAIKGEAERLEQAEHSHEKEQPRG